MGEREEREEEKEARLPSSPPTNTIVSPIETQEIFPKEGGRGREQRKEGRGGVGEEEGEDKEGEEDEEEEEGEGERGRWGKRLGAWV